VTVNDGQNANNTATATSTINITAVNDAPVASGSATLAAVDEDTTSPAGATVGLTLPSASALNGASINMQPKLNVASKGKSLGWVSIWKIITVTQAFTHENR
jgi:hypothetical protein